MYILYIACLLSLIVHDLLYLPMVFSKGKPGCLSISLFLSDLRAGTGIHSLREAEKAGVSRQWEIFSECWNMLKYVEICRNRLMLNNTQRKQRQNFATFLWVARFILTLSSAPACFTPQITHRSLFYYVLPCFFCLLSMLHQFRARNKPWIRGGFLCKI